MYQDKGNSLAALFESDARGGSGKACAEFEQLLGTVVSAIDFGDDGILKLMGNDREGQAVWRLRIGGSARFTFSRRSGDGSWLVETNFDAGAPIRSSERTMMLAICGAVIDSVRAEKEGLFILSDDGRGIEIPYALNEDGIIIDILPHSDRSMLRSASNRRDSAHKSASRRLKA